jgi:hypothetical protein
MGVGCWGSLGRLCATRHKLVLHEIMDISILHHILNYHLHSIKKVISFALIFPQATYFLHCERQVCQQSMSSKCHNSNAPFYEFKSELLEKYIDHLKLT